MTETPEHPGVDTPKQKRKGCQISLMFPCDNDEEALAVKKAIDAVVPDVEGKRYTFQITEM